MKNFMALTFSSLFLLGCLATSKPISGPDGTQNQLITCGSIEYCYEKASEVCANGPYKLVDKNVENSTDSDGKMDTKTTFLIKCEN